MIAWIVLQSQRIVTHGYTRQFIVVFFSSIDRAIEIDSNYSDPLANKGILFMRIQVYDEAIYNFHKAYPYVSSPSMNQDNGIRIFISYVS